MASRRERCSECGRQLVVPLQAQIVRCSACNTITRFQPDNTWGQINDSPTNTAMSDYNTSRISAGPVNSYIVSGPYVHHPANYNYYSRPPVPRPLSSPASVYGRKRALLCGVSYVGKSYRLKGSINDVRSMKNLLIQAFGFPNDSILMLTEDGANPLPTKQNMRKALRWLVQGCQSGDSLVFHYSGHGSRQRDYNDDEIDGQDEALCPLDHETEGIIIDDEINDTIVRPLPYGVKLHAIIDACYSGTVLDLQFFCRMKREGSYVWEDHSTPACYKGTNGGLAICISACDDNQTTGNTTAFTGSAMTGAMTYSFIKAVQSEPGSTYGRLVNSMRYAIREAQSGMRLNGPMAYAVNRVAFNSDTSQEPQLSSSKAFDIYSTKFTL